VSIRSRMRRLERHWPRTDPANLWYPTLDERATLIRKVLGRLGRPDPFPTLQCQGYLDAFTPWFKAGGIYPPEIADLTEGEPSGVGLLS
jgi:hypothetical protein